ncbi:unnamed protein product [Didymodactylos carnosus]|uniref:Endonuclease/exonuclease/phosphatase domain-containing protein n=1 Tax=Didymodactylos carnosus TaxID=1234261 RepID=A0A813QPF4_9BILA|nr:unnamed protein product [Didymodactylos carnosus]CAF0770848.1 unnamed protein product [Didymodactylos carnosus]CAF3539913.1 unnamed protein product [Didymodactylos carnosus]CAF3552968.1 unnamed protein product [Didymodactylos carnosus]
MSPLLLPSSLPRSTSLRLMTYNIMRGRYTCYQDILKMNPLFTRGQLITTRSEFMNANLVTIAKIIAQFQPDVLALQEIQENFMTIKNSINEQEISSATYLANLLNMSVVFHPSLFDSDVQMQYGNAILFNNRSLKYLNLEVVSLPLGLEPRNTPCVLFDKNNVMFYTCAIHLDHDTNNRVRTRQARVLVDWAKQKQHVPVTFLGDFNDNSTSETMNILKDIFTTGGSPNDPKIELPTWSECREPLTDKIDYILIDKRYEWIVEQFMYGLEIITPYRGTNITMFSDHLPLFMSTILHV